LVTSALPRPPIMPAPKPSRIGLHIAGACRRRQGTTSAGRSAEEWTAANSTTLNVMLPDGVPCPEIAKLIPKRPSPTSVIRSKSEPIWGVQLIGDASETNALAAYRPLQKRYTSILGSYQPLIIQNRGKSASWYRVRVGTNTRESAEKLCSSLRAAGGSCLVQRN
jgi:hypothetical protein